MMDNEKLNKAIELENRIGKYQGYLDKISILKTGYIANRDGYWLAIKSDNSHGVSLNDFIDESILDACKSLIQANVEKKLINLKAEFETL